MTFETESPRTPIGIGNIIITLKDSLATNEESAYKAAHFDVIVQFSNGSYIHRTGNLRNHLTTQQCNALEGFLGDMRLKAQDEILP